jgi:SAM-dependent MidA family methyltransferase
LNRDKAIHAKPRAPVGDLGLVARLRAAMDEAGGDISFAEYMDLALFAPRLGYYSAGAEQFGSGGDFLTAPESSTLFAACVAVQVSEVLAGIGGGDICELGAGSGVLAVDLLERLAESDCLPRRYVVIERSAALRERQRAHLGSRLPELATRVEWLNAIPRDLCGVVLANEVLDVIPAHRFRVHAGGFHECRVAWRDNRFVWTERDCTGSGLAEHIEAILGGLEHRLPGGYVSECAPARQHFIADVGSRLKQGMLLLFDYGYGRAEYYHPQRSNGTLRCFHRHRTHDDPLILAGLQDISVHVDFTAIAQAALDSGLALAGYTTQADFLLATGLLDACEGVNPATRRYAELTAQIKRLTLPGQMGEAVKVLALTRRYDKGLLGFSGRDMRARLELEVRR